GITRIRGVAEMVRAMDFLPADANARLALAGPFDSPALEREVEDLAGIDRTDLLGPLQRDKVAEHLGSGRVGLVLLHPVPAYLESVPTKMFEYMAAGLPVIASNFPAWRTLIEGIGCGLVANPLDPADIAHAIQWIFEHPAEAEEMGERGREAVLKDYNWEAEARRLVEAYDRL
ncbi:MAG: glycosyltransferase, partial [Gemmatimonadales bacterium]